MVKEIVNRLVTVKSIVTLILTIVFAILAISGSIVAGEFLNIFYMVIAFYFGSQVEKNALHMNQQQ